MRIERIELETADQRVEMSFHPSLTVVTGLGRLEREALATEILGALGAGRPGLSVDVVADNGRRVSVTRPVDGSPPLVIDRSANDDLTDRFTANGSVDVLATLGLSWHDARRHLHVAPADIDAAMAADPWRPDETIARLGALDQTALWRKAIEVAELEVEIATLVERFEQDPTLHLATEIEHAHAERDLAADRLETARSRSFIGSAALTLIAFFVALITHPVIAVPFLAAACWLAYESWQAFQEFQQAQQAEDEILAKAGVGSYLNYQLRKVDELTNNGDLRARSLELGERHRRAMSEWEDMVGAGVTLEWAAARRAEITEAATRDEGGSWDVARGRRIATHLTAAVIDARAAARESLPMIIDDVFTDVDDGEIHGVLDVIATYGPHAQFLVMTDDERVGEWASELAARGAALLLGLGGGDQRSTAAPSRRRASRPRRSDSVGQASSQASRQTSRQTRNERRIDGHLRHRHLHSATA